MTLCACNEFSANVSFHQSAIFDNPDVSRIYMYSNIAVDGLCEALIVSRSDGSKRVAIGTVENANGKSIVFRTQPGAGAATEERVRITDQGNVGIGIESPEAPLQVGKAAANVVRQGVVRLATSNGFGGYRSWDIGTSSVTGWTYNFAIVDVISGRRAFEIDWQGGRIGMNTPPTGGQLDVKASGAITETLNLIASDTNSTVGLALKSAGGTAAARLFTDTAGNEARLKALGKLTLRAGDAGAGTSGAAVTILPTSGNVGLGTDNPITKLEIVSDHDAQVIRFKRSDGSHPAGIGATEFGKALRFFTNDAERVRIDPVGNVGIGTPTPQAPLDVRGGIRLGDSTTPGATPNGLMVYRTQADNATYLSLISDGVVTGTVMSGASPRRADLIFTNDAQGHYIFTNSHGNVRVGIGKTNPAVSLDVDGEIQATKPIRATGSGADGIIYGKGFNVDGIGDRIDSAGKVYGAVYG